MISQEIKDLLEAREFISVASCDLRFRPNAAPKFLLKVEGSYVYLVDYVIGRTFSNIKANPRVSISFFDNNSLIGYQLNGKVEIISAGQEYQQAKEQLQRREVDLATTRIIDGVLKGQAHKAYEVAAAQQFIILKVKVEEIVHLHPGGFLKRERV